MGELEEKIKSIETKVDTLFKFIIGGKGNVLGEIYIPKGSTIRVYRDEEELLLRVFPKEYNYVFMAIEVQPVKSG